MESINHNTAPISKEEEKEEWKRMGNELLDALMRGDANYVTLLFSPVTEASLAIDLSDADNVADQAGSRSCQGVTVGRNSALHIVATFGHLELAKLICARDSSLLEARNAALETPLHCAAKAGEDRIVSLFISEARQLEALLRATDREGKTALHAAAEQGHAAVARVLVSADPGLAAIVDNNSVSPLYAAVLSNSLQVVQILIEFPAEGGKQAGTTSAGATPKTSYAGPNRQTALHAAAIVQSPEITNELLKWEPKLAKKVDDSESTPLHYLVTTTNTHMNPEIWICHCLQQIGAIHGTPRLDRLIYDSKHKDSAKQNRENEPNKYESAKQNRENEPNKYESAKQNRENEPNKYETTAQNLVIVSVLIATVTFAAAFTMPGGIIADDHQNGGTPTLARKYAFTAFIISDCIAFCCSIMATIWLIYAGSLAIHHSGQLKLILRSQDFMDVAAQCMMVAFALSLYVVLAPVYFSFALAVCLSVFPSVFFSSPEFWQRFHLTWTLKRRLGWSAMCKARVIGPPLGLATNSINWYIFPSMENFNWYIFRPIASYLLVYMLIFGASLIFSIKHIHFI